MDKNTVLPNSEQKILDAAKKVFLQKGMYGARMQEIAEEAGINKALLHYYFRSKKQLFIGIFKAEFMKFGPRLFDIFNSPHSMEHKLRALVMAYTDMLSKNPFLPVFIINEIHQNPELLIDLKDVLQKIKSSKIIEQLNEGIKQGKYIPIKPEQFVTNLLAWSIFPFLSKPILTNIFMMEDDFPGFMEERNKIIPEMLMKSIKK